MIMAPDNNETATMTISGGNLKIDNNSLLIFGKNGNRTATITQSGGNVTFYSDAGTTVGGTGGIYFVNQSNHRQCPALRVHLQPERRHADRATDCEQRSWRHQRGHFVTSMAVR